MDAPVYVNILEQTLLPFVQGVTQVRIHQTAMFEFLQYSRITTLNMCLIWARQFLANNEITWWNTPPESPDLNPIENMWHKLKEYIRREPRTKDELIKGIEEFWGLVFSEKCRMYIRNLHKVIPRIIEVGGAATGY